MKDQPLDPTSDLNIPDVLPVLPIREPAVFPWVMLPLSVGREAGIAAIDAGLAEDRLLFIVAQRDPEVEAPRAGDLHEVGTIASIMRMLKLPDGRVRILVQGLTRARIKRVVTGREFLRAHLTVLKDQPTDPKVTESGRAGALARAVREELERVVQLGRPISTEVLVVAANLDDPGRLADLAASNLDLGVDESQALLENLDPVDRLDRIHRSLARESHLLTLQAELSSQAREEIDRGQREFLLRQQLRQIQSELGEGDDLAREVEQWRAIAVQRSMSAEAVEELEKQIRRLERSHPDSAEAALSRTWIDWLVGLPWGVISDDVLDLRRARQILDEDHWDLEKVKTRLLEFLAVRMLKPDAPGPILCLVGPPGVGKTSLGRSIARAMGRKFVRVSLGGVRDEAEIRGHRRTYVGAMPGRILQALHQAGTANPVLLLDEIDKLGTDGRSDPSAALLEVLDPEQNTTFRDHYLALPYDLSKVLFLATANLLDPIHPAFLDRLEVVRLSGYTIEEKVAIAKRHLIPRQRTAHGLTAKHLRFTDAGIRAIADGWTREAGLRQLEREIAALCRRSAMRVAEGDSSTLKIGPRGLEPLLGAPRYLEEERLEAGSIGVATGLAWTAVGGETMLVEIAATPGKGQLTLTGQLGDVMKESAQAALTCVRSLAPRLGISATYFAEHDLHVHVPAGAIPKDGPSAGITIATALTSLASGRPVDRDVAMTGEITLRGRVLPIGGLREKVLAARASKIATVLVPAANHRDGAELPPEIREGVELVYVRSLEEVLARALGPAPAASR